jgi:hypothetical protein
VKITDVTLQGLHLIHLPTDEGITGIGWGSGPNYEWVQKYRAA